MKKIIRLLAILAVVCLMGMLFCGCDMLDEMKERHAILSDDKESISFRGQTFLKLPSGAYPYINENSETIYATDADVPVLLSQDFGTYADYDSLRGLIKVYENDVYVAQLDYYGYYVEEKDHYSYYCRKDVYDKYLEIIETNHADRIGFYDFGELYYTAVLSSGASEEIMSFMESPQDMTAEVYELAMQKEYDCIYDLYRCDKEILLRETLYNYAFSITDEREVYFVNHTTGTGAKLSAGVAEEITEDYYEYGSNRYGN